MSGWLRRTIIALVVVAGAILLWGCPPSAPRSSAPLPPPSPPPATASLNVPYEQQLAELWCWAASAVMVVKFLGRNTDQCEAAQLQLGQNCCNAGQPRNVCNHGDWPPFHQLGFLYSQTHSTALTLQQLMVEIGVRGRPVALSWEFTDLNGGRTGSGHMVVAIGYTTNGVDSSIEIYDPLCDAATPVDPAHPCGWRTIPYSDYVSGTGYLHWDDFYEIRSQ